MTAQKNPYITATEYLTLEHAATYEAKLFAGQVVPMDGATMQHNRIVSNLMGNINSYVIGKPCEIFPSDLRVRVGLDDSFTYSDATIGCGNPEMVDEQFDTVTNPTVLIEVMSKSTEKRDRGAKFFAYMQIPSWQEYQLISSTGYFVQPVLRKEDGAWKFKEITDLQKDMPIHAIQHHVPLTMIYGNVAFA
jgi:Uma2 family endonuclease